MSTMQGAALPTRLLSSCGSTTTGRAPLAPDQGVGGKAARNPSGQPGRWARHVRRLFLQDGDPAIPPRQGHDPKDGQQAKRPNAQELTKQAGHPLMSVQRLAEV